MRSAIFLGLVYVAKAIKTDFISEKGMETLLIMLTAFIVMDIVEFIKYLTKD